MRLLTAICVIALAVAFTAPAFAETQNIKVSGDIRVLGLMRNNIGTERIANGLTHNDANIIMQQVGLNVEADLTDNVSTFVRILNERDWNASDATNMDIGLDEAYVTIKEMLYAPLTVKIGRQNLWFGKGFIIGSNNTAWDQEGNLTMNEVSDMTAFDAIRGTLDYDPWTIDLVYSKIEENTVDLNDDINLYGANIGYVFDEYNAEAETYYWQRHNRSNVNALGAVTGGEVDQIHTVGVRGSLMPYDNMNVWAEGAYQCGSYVEATNDESGDRNAWALDIGTNYQWTETNWTPILGAEYILYSGADATNHTGSDSTWDGWDVMYRGKFDSMIRDYQNVLYPTAADNTLSTSRNNGTTNQHQVVIMGTVNPMDDVTVNANVNLFWFDEEVNVDANSSLSAGTSDESYIGTELDGMVTYDYTEDVTFTVAGGVFWPSDYSPSGKDQTASQVISAVSVDF